MGVSDHQGPHSPTTMVNTNLNVVFGQDPDAYLITYGRKFVHEKMPESLIKSLTNESDVHPMKLAWVRLVLGDHQSGFVLIHNEHRLHPNGLTWAAKNMYNNNGGCLNLCLAELC